MGVTNILMHETGMLFLGQSVVQPYVHKNTCSGEHADASPLTIEGMARVLSASIYVKKNVVLHIQGLGFDWQSKKMRREGRTRY